MITVSNTSPISNLAIIGRLDLLRMLYGEVEIPEAVRRELKALRHVSAQAAICDAGNQGWLVTSSVSNRELAVALCEELDAGEAEAITLAAEEKARLVMDELEGRSVAKRLGIPVRGTLWVLKKGKEAGAVSSLKQELDRLREDAHFWISSKLEAKFLSEAGE